MMIKATCYKDINFPYTINFTSSKFPGGEIYVKVDPAVSFKGIDRLEFIATLKSSDNIMELIMLKNAVDNILLEERSSPEMVLVMGYVPYARQDRICSKGESFSIKVFAELINSLNFDLVITYDNHSDVSTALLKNCLNVSVENIIDSNIVREYDFIVSPDAGSNKKIQKVREKVSKEESVDIPFIRADKYRDSNGKILDTIVFCDSLEDKKVIIIDDICDGGMTFIKLAEKLKQKGAKEVALFVTHGIFSKGFEPLYEFIDKIYYTGSLTSGTLKIVEDIRSIDE